MSARGPRRDKTGRTQTWYQSRWLRGLLQWALAGYLALALAGPTAPWWWSLLGSERVDLLPGGNAGGPIGAVANLVLRVLCGAAWCWMIPLLLLVGGTGQLLRRPQATHGVLHKAVPLWLASTAWLAQPHGVLAPGPAAAWGGIVGTWLARGFHVLFGLWGGRIFLTFLLVVSLGLLLQPITRPLLAIRWKRPGWVAHASASGLALGRRLAGQASALARWGHQAVGPVVAWLRGRPAGTPSSPAAAPARRPMATARSRATVSGPEPAEARAAADEAPGGLPDADEAGAGSRTPPAVGRVATARPDVPVAPAGGPLVLPPLSLLKEAEPEPKGNSPAALDAAADLLEETLRSFGVVGEVKEVRPGPVVTTFEYQPAAGIKVVQIIQRSNDLALAMKARSIRMEAPIPGKAAVGIEIPNQTAQIVRLKEVLEQGGEQRRTPLTVVLGKDVVGQPVVIDIASLPHLLVAGSTGSGKSVCLNGIICNLLLRNDPERVRLVLIDPKMLEMNVYNGLPHLLLPVVTDPKEALRALRWMVAQMDLRYRILARAGVRNIEAYNLKVARGEVTDSAGEPVGAPMPYYLTIVDELADLMLQLGQDFEVPITRLAQKARAVGIHLILATQRPSVDVLTGVIKANIPCRIAFRVIQKNDSRTILDTNGAEQLLGHGDMLYLQPGRALPVRVHGAFIEVEECEAIVRHWLQYADRYPTISLTEETGESGVYTGDDDLFEDARRIVVLHQSGSTSLLQRRLRVGYTRAGRLMDMLEEAGVVGPFTGSKARDVLIRPEDLPDFDGVQAEEGEA